MQIEYTATVHASNAIAALGRTEDVRFSPDNRRLAVAAFLKNAVPIFELRMDASLGEKPVAIINVLEISSPYLKRPHGIDFIDDETIIVANRDGDACIFRVPPTGAGTVELLPIEVIRSGEVIDAPGSVSIVKTADGHYEALLCNNYTNKITRHLINPMQKYVVERSDVLLEKWLDIPDGVSVNGDWIAVSNHNRCSVFLYDRTCGLNSRSKPDGILRSLCYPHGLRFTSDGRFILVADAGAPYVHIYGRGASGWRGVYQPLRSLRTVTNEEFLRGRTSVEEGGPKGIDIDSSASILVTTCEAKPLAFFKLAEILDRLSPLSMRHNSDCSEAAVQRASRKDVEME